MREETHGDVKKKDDLRYTTRSPRVVSKIDRIGVSVGLRMLLSVTTAKQTALSVVPPVTLLARKHHQCIER